MDQLTPVDEIYAFPGDPERDKPAYTIIRMGRTVVDYLDRDGRPSETTCDSEDAARAVFADSTADPDGPGAPRVGDTVFVRWGNFEDRFFRVDTVEVAPEGERWQFQVRAKEVRHQEVSTEDYVIRLDFWQYTITSRPALIDA